jgi:hypothetical protein
MSHSLQQDKEDTEVFQEFARSEGGPGLHWDSVKHGREPLPDMVCQSAGTFTYYELTQVDPEKLYNLVSSSQSDRQDPSSNRHLLTSTEWPLFRAKYRGYVFDLGEPKESVHPQNAVRRVFKYLLKHDPSIDFPQGPDGETLVLYDDIAPDGDLDVSLHQLHQHSDYLSICNLPGVCLYPMSSVEDPEIWPGAVTSRNPAISAIATKSKRPYRDESGRQPPHPAAFDLVLWTDISGFLEETTEYLESSIGRSVWQSVFGSVWLFDRVRQRIACHVLGPAAPTEHL